MSRPTLIDREISFGPVRFIPGPKQGRVPYCHSIYIEGAGVLIDPAGDRQRFRRLRDEDGVNQIWLSHWHEDHFMDLDLFEDAELWICALDAPPLTDIEIFLDWYDMRGPLRDFWGQVLVDFFHYQPRTPQRLIEPGEIIDAAGVVVHALHTPGHTPGHLSFWFPEQGVLHLADYDLTSFGPWYADVDSSIDDCRRSVEMLRGIPANIWIPGHEFGALTQDPGRLWDDFLAVIDQRHNRLDQVLESGPQSLRQLVEHWIVYGKAREPLDYYIWAEGCMLKKHLEQMTARGEIRREGSLYVRT